jgi:hypothetical protein
MKRNCTSYKNVLLSKLLQPYNTTKIAFNIFRSRPYMVLTIPPILNKMNNNLSHRLIEHKNGFQGLARDRPKTVGRLNLLMNSPVIIS